MNEKLKRLEVVLNECERKIFAEFEEVSKDPEITSENIECKRIALRHLDILNRSISNIRYEIKCNEDGA